MSVSWVVEVGCAKILGINAVYAILEYKAIFMLVENFHLQNDRKWTS